MLLFQLKFYRQSKTVDINKVNANTKFFVFALISETTLTCKPNCCFHNNVRNIINDGFEASTRISEAHLKIV